MEVWEYQIALANKFIETFEQTGTEVYEEGMDKFNKGNWVNRVWTSESYRRAHVDIVDARDEKGLWMMHVCIFPHLDSDAPIFGYDAVAGRGKLTGAFHDFSATVNPEHEMIASFAREVAPLEWKRERELPPWGKAIFTDNMLAAGNVRTEAELTQLNDIVESNLEYFISNVGNYSKHANVVLGTKAQNRYAYYQKQNPHTPRVMKSIGLDPDDVEDFIQNHLFPDLMT